MCDPICWYNNITLRKEKKMKRLVRQDPVPFNLKIYKGAKSWKLPRSFVSFLLNSPVSLQFIEWSRLTWIPDEMVVPTLARLSRVTESEGKMVGEQLNVPSENHHFQLWKKGCRGVLRSAEMLKIGIISNVNVKSFFFFQL